MKIETEFVNYVTNNFQKLAGKASLYSFEKTMITALVFKTIMMFINKHPTEQIFIVVDKYLTRLDIINYFIKNNIDINNFNIKILSQDYINVKYNYNYNLIITIGINDDFKLIQHLYKGSKFMMCILSKNIMDNEFITNVRNILPDINTSKYNNVARTDYIYCPVEEQRYGVALSDNVKSMYDKYNKYINNAISIFGSLDIIEKCKHGDAKNNISASEIRYNLAKENGWNENLNTTIEFLKQIDDIYNPNNLLEKANNFYNIAKQRRNLVINYEEKINKIIEICIENQDKKILIISKKGEFAANITKAINRINDPNIKLKCGDYHDCVEDMIATDANGNTILFKSGVNKGKPKIIKSQAISSYNMAQFNEGYINVLSIKNSSSNALKIECDLVIITSPYCENIIDIKKRFSNIKINHIPNKIYTIYCLGSIEEDLLRKTPVNSIINVINNEENFINYSEDLNGIIL